MQAAAPHLGQLDTGLGGDQGGVRRGDGVGAYVVLIDAFARTRAAFSAAAASPTAPAPDPAAPG